MVFGAWVKGSSALQILDNFDSASPTSTGQLLKKIAHSYRTSSTMVEYNGAVTGAGETTYLAGTEYWSFYYYKAYFQTTATTETMQVEIGRSFDINEFLVPANRAALPLGGG